MPSSRTIESRSFADASGRKRARLALGVVVACGLSLACSRPKSEPAEPAADKPASTALAAEAASAPEPPASADDTATLAPTLNGPPASTLNGPPAPEATPASLTTVSAERLLAEVQCLGGKGTLVNAWASWCGPCKHDIPMLEKLAAKLEPRGVHVLLVSLDEPEDRDKAAAFLHDRHIALTSYLAERPLGVFKQGMNPRWPGMLPASFLYDTSGALRYFWGGEAFEDELTPVLDAFAAGKPIEGEANPAIAPEGEAR